MKKLMMLVAVLAVGMFAAQEAKADGSCGGIGQALYGGWGRAGLYTTGRVPVPPYFALHPPVYYSYPVPRTYGYSPFAYPGSVKTPTVKAVAKPVSISNPYVNQPKQADSTKAKTASHKKTTPQTILNPYINQVAAVE